MFYSIIKIWGHAHTHSSKTTYYLPNTLLFLLFLKIDIVSPKFPETLPHINIFMGSPLFNQIDAYIWYPVVILGLNHRTGNLHLSSHQ